MEDTSVSVDQIRHFLRELMTESELNRTINLVIELTDVFVKDAYPKLNRRKRKALETSRLSQTSADAQSIKYADLIDNAVDIIRHDPQFGRVFVYEARGLLLAMNKGNEELRQMAITTIDGCLDKLKRSEHKSAHP